MQHQLRRPQACSTDRSRMGALKWIAYGLTGALIAAIWLVGGAVIAALASIIGVILVGAAVAGFATFVIKDYVEGKKDRS